MILQGLYSLARSVGAVMFENHVLETFKLPNRNTVVEKLYGFSLVNNDDVYLIKESAATGFDCGVPAEPSVRKLTGHVMGAFMYVYYITVQHTSQW